MMSSVSTDDATLRERNAAYVFPKDVTSHCLVSALDPGLLTCCSFGGCKLGRGCVTLC